MSKLVWLLIFLQLAVVRGHTQVVMSALNTAVLYVGLENEVSVSVPTYGCDDFYLECNECKITGSGCDYKIVPGKAADIAPIYVHSKSNPNKIIDSIKVAIRYLPHPIIEINDYSCHNMNWTPFRSGPKLKFLPYDFPVATTITSYSLQIYRKGNIIFSTVNDGAAYNADAWNAIKNMKSGDLLKIDEMKVRGPGKLHWELQVFSFYKP